MFEVPPLCENESDDAPNGSYDLISSFGTYTNQKPHRVSLKKLGWINGVNPLFEVKSARDIDWDFIAYYRRHRR